MPTIATLVGGIEAVVREWLRRKGEYWLGGIAALVGDSFH